LFSGVTSTSPSAAATAPFQLTHGLWNAIGGLDVAVVARMWLYPTNNQGSAECRASPEASPPVVVDAVGEIRRRSWVQRIGPSRMLVARLKVGVVIATSR
jgi:hypothetical protein